MQQLKIDSKSMYDIVNKWGFPSDLSEFEATYKCDASPADIEKFKEQIISLSKSSTKKRKTEDSEKKFSEYLDIISKNESIFDKNLYLLHVARLLKEDYSAQYNSDNENEIDTNRVYTSEEYSDMAKKALLIRSAKKILSNLDIANIRIRKDENGKERYEIYTSSEFISEDRSKIDEREEKVREQLKKINQKIGLEKILKFFEPDEFFNQDELDVCKYENLSYLCKKQVESQKDEKCQISKIAEIIRNYPEYIDIDKLLVMATIRYYQTIEYDIETIPYEEVEKLKSFTENVKLILLSKSTKAKPYCSSTRNVSFKELEKEIKKLCSHFINGKYYQEYEKNDLVKDIITGKTSLHDFSKEDFLNLSFSQREVSEMIFRNPTSIEFLVTNNLEKIEEVREKVELQRNVNFEQLVACINSKVLDYEDIMRLYYDKKISIETVKSLKQKLEEEKKSEELKKLTGLVSSKVLVKMLLSKDEQNAEEYIRLYKALIIDGKTLEEKKDIANEILDYSLDLLEEEKMYELYYEGLIPVDSLLDIIGDQSSGFEDLFKNGEIKPIDARRLYLDGIITEQNFVNLLSSMEDGERLALICAVFPNSKDENELDLREKLLQTMSPIIRSTYGKNDKASTNRNTSNNSNNDKNNKSENRRMSDPCLRWNFLSNLDKEFSQQYLRDGTVIFYLPNEGSYIIEKLFDKNMEPCYGVATYILDKEDFDKYKDIIIDKKNSCIRPKILPRLREENENVTKIVHTGWGNALTRYFEIDSNEKYTEEQKDVIHSLAEEIDEQTRRKNKFTNEDGEEPGNKKDIEDDFQIE